MMDDSMHFDNSESQNSKTTEDTETREASLISKDDLKNELYDCLDTLQSAGTYAVFEHLPNPINPGLYVNGAGNIGLPLSERDAKAIFDASLKVPSPKGSLKRPGEVPAAYFQTRNPAWGQVVDTAIQKVISGLGIHTNGGSVKTQLHTMCLYDQNVDIHAPLANAKKIPGVFGTLSICLPSKHGGGDVHLKHLGQNQVFRTDKDSEFNASFMAWYSTVLYERKPVQSGHRLVLTYNLSYVGAATGSDSASIEESTRLLGLFTSWMKAYQEHGVPEALVYKLEHSTTEKLCYDSLGGDDQQIVMRLKEACLESGFNLYLAKLERLVSGTCEEEEYDDYYHRYACDEDNHHEIIEVSDATITLKEVFDLDGTKISDNIRIKEEEMIQDYLFEKDPGRDPDDEGYDGEGFVSHFYWEWAVVILPKGGRVPILFDPIRRSYLDRDRSNQVTLGCLKDIKSRLDSNPLDEGGLEDLVQVYRIIINRMKDFFVKKPLVHSPDVPYSVEVLSSVCSGTMALGRSVGSPSLLETGRNMFLEILDFDFSKIQPIKSSQSFFLALGSGVAVLGLKSLESILNGSINRLSNFHDRYDILYILAEGFRIPVVYSKSELLIPGNREIVAFSAWLNERHNETLTLCDLSEVEDVVCLFKMIKTLGPQFLTDKVIPMIKRHEFSPGIAMAFAINLLKAGDEDEIARNIALDAFRDILPDIIEQFSLQVTKPRGNKRQKTGTGISYVIMDSETGSKLAKDSLSLAVILCKCQTLSMTTEIDQIISKMLTEVHIVSLEYFTMAILEFLKTVLSHLLARGADLTEPRFQLLYQQGLAIYIDRYVQPEPVKSADWSRAPTDCVCHHCIDLNIFLRSPVHQQFRCNNGQQARKHLESVAMYRDRADYIFETDKRRSPHTLIITKTAANSQFLRDQAAWKQRGEIAKQQMKDLGIVPLRKLLGDQFDATLDLRWVKLGARSPRNGVLNHMAQAPADDVEVIVIE